MATGQTVKVNREKLLKVLKDRLEELKATGSKSFEDSKKREIANHERQIAQWENRIKEEKGYIAKIKATKNLEELGDLIGYGRTYTAHYQAKDLSKLIVMLELSDEESVTVRPTSEIYPYITG